MKNTWLHIKYLLYFILLTITTYLVITFIDYTFDFFIVIKIIPIGFSYYYFYKVTEHINSSLFAYKKKVDPNKFKKNGWTLIIPGILIFAFQISIALATESLNYQLILSDNKQTTATIKDCSKSKGTEYCIYSYSVDNKNYEIKYCNESTNLKLKEYDTATVIYYSKFPIISKLKKELQ